ncbi:MAG: hypothetical protein CM15mP103_07120 [Gammaproteobacteria bacterium]|nr:MAG: hypothetical protein CM15mP103_07120 [Gammaproteobacteria bacterium]
MICHRPGLTPVACEAHAGLIFVSMADTRPRSKKPLASRGLPREYQIDQMRVVRQCEANGARTGKWASRRFTRAITCTRCTRNPRCYGDLNVQYDCYPTGASRMIVPLGQPSPRQADQTTVNEGLQFMLQEGVDPAGFTGTAPTCAPRFSRPSGSGLIALAWVMSASPMASFQIAGRPESSQRQIGCHPRPSF